MGYIYKITNTINNKIYIGQTIRSVSLRFTEHLSSAHFCKNYLGKAITKYGRDAFVVETIEECEDSILNIREKYWIKFYQSNNKEYGYNLTEGGEMSSDDLKREIYQFTLEGKLIQKFDSISIAARTVLGSDSCANLCAACKGKIATSGGYLWSYDNNPPILNKNYIHYWSLFKYDVYDKNDKKVYSNLTIKELQDFLKLKSVSSINNMLNGDTKSAGSYYCDAIDYINLAIVIKEGGRIKNQSSHKHNCQKVNQYNLNGEYLQTFNSIAEAENNVKGSNKGHISQVCQGTRQTAYGYKWAYAK